MDRTTTKYAAADLAEDLINGINEVLTDAEDTLEATPDAEHDDGEWEVLRNAIEEARRMLKEMETELDLKQIAADNAEREDAPEELESFWD